MVGRSIERWAHRKQLLYIYTERHYHHSQNDDGDTYLLGAFAEHFTALEIIRNFVSGLTVFYTKIPFINYVNACVRCSDIRLFVSFTIIFTLVLSFVQFHFVYIWKFMSEMLKCVCERTQPFCFPKAISRIDRCISIFWGVCVLFFGLIFSPPDGHMNKYFISCIFITHIEWHESSIPTAKNRSMGTKKRKECRIFKHVFSQFYIPDNRL